MLDEKLIYEKDTRQNGHHPEASAEVKVPTEKVLDKASDKMQDLMDRMPNWFVRWGITFLMLILLGGVLLSWVIQYPDMVAGEVIINANQAPVKLVARQSGKLKLLGVAPKDPVEEGRYVAYIENPADFRDVMDLKAKLATYTPKMKKDAVADMLFAKVLSLGEIQIPYNQFLQALGEWRLFINTNRHEAQLTALSKQKEKYQALLESGGKSRKTVKEEVALYQKHAGVDAKLYRENAIAERSYETSRANFLGKYNTLRNLGDNLLRIELQLIETENTMAMLQLEREETEERLYLQLSETFNALTAAIAQWEEYYMIKPPVGGRLEFMDFWENGQFVEAGSELFSIAPFSQVYKARVKLPLLGAGKVKKGQQVKIQLFNYPYHEFGFLYGQVTDISLVTQEKISVLGPEQVYLITVKLPEGLKTSFNRELDFQYDMAGIGEIITEDRRLLERIFENFKYLFKDRRNRR